MPRPAACDGAQGWPAHCVFADTRDGSAHFGNDPTATAAEFSGAVSDDTLTVSAMVFGSIVLDQVITSVTGASVTRIIGMLTGTGQTGTYSVSPPLNVSATDWLAALAIATKWRSLSYAAPGELVRITGWPLG